jgi:hypothetical protein
MNRCSSSHCGPTSSSESSTNRPAVASALLASTLGAVRPAHIPAKPELHDRTHMPRTKTSAATRKLSPYERVSSAEINAMIERIAPDILVLFADGVPRNKAAIVEALAGRHERQDVISTLIRLAVTEQVLESGGRYTLVRPVPDVG